MAILMSSICGGLLGGFGWNYTMDRNWSWPAAVAVLGTLAVAQSLFWSLVVLPT